MTPNTELTGISDVTSDGVGGACIYLFSGSLTEPTRLIRLDPNGATPSDWPPGGAAVRARWDGYVVGDGVGGFYVYFRTISPDYDIGVMHISPTGVPIPGWGDANGVVRLHRSDVWYDDYPHAVPDGQGGLYIAWESLTFSSVAIKVQHLGADGAPVASWPDTGLTLVDLPEARGGVSVIADGSGAYVAWSDRRAGRARAYVQRISSQGQVEWPDHPTGRAITPTDHDYFSYGTAPDAQGGLHVAIGDLQDEYFLETDAYLQHLLPTGAFAPGFSAAPKSISAFPGQVQNLAIMPDGSGGAYLSWDDYRTGGLDFYVHRVGPDGVPLPGWPVGGLAVGNEPFHWELRGHMATDMQGGVYCAFNSEGGEGDRVMLQHLRGDGTRAPGYPPGGVEMALGLPVLTAFDEDASIDSDGRGGVILAWNRQIPSNRALNGVYAQRFGPGTVVATTLSLVGSHAEPGNVTLEWQVGGDALMSATLERRTQGDAEWATLATLTPDGERRLRYEDREVAAGERYAYRLAYSVVGDLRRTAESWIDIPTAHVFSFRGPSRSPSVRGALSMDLSLRGTAPARLELYDVTGRRVVERDLRGTAPGRRTLAVPEAASLEPGLYWARLSEGADEARARVVLLK